jgi:GNAT superfamily N-acetyltransferase
MMVDGLVVTIGALVVEPTYRGLGLGKALAKVAVAWYVHGICAHEVRALAMTEELAQWYGRMEAILDRDRSEVVAIENSRGCSLSVEIRSLKGKPFEDSLAALGIPNNVQVKRKAS